MVDQFEAMATEKLCPYCHSADRTIDYSLPWDDDRFDGYDVVTCKQCSISFADPFPDPETLQRLYDSLQYQDADRKGGNPEELTDDQLEALVSRERFFVDKYADRIAQSGHVLDVGAGWGLLLKHLENRGWIPHGVELSSIQTRFAHQKLGLDVHELSVDEIESIDLPKLDLIIFRHTLEHFYDPKSVLVRLRELCKPDARLIIEVPDYQSYDRRAYGESWPAFGPWHLWYFSQKSLSRLLADTGFRPLRFQRFMSDRIFGSRTNPLSKLARKAINRIGGKTIFSGRTIGVLAERMGSESSS